MNILQSKYIVELRQTGSDVTVFYAGDSRDNVISAALQYFNSHSDVSYFQFYKL